MNERDALHEINRRTRKRIRRIQGDNPRACDCGWCKEMWKIAELAEEGLAKAHHEARLCPIVRDWHEWYVSEKYFASPPTPTEHLIDMCHDLGYGVAFGDVRAIHSFIESSYYVAWSGDTTGFTECRHHLNLVKCCVCSLEKAKAERDQAKSVCRFLRSELRKARRENRELRNEYGPTFREIWEKQQREKLLADIIEQEKAEVMRRMKPLLEKLQAETWDKIWNGDPDAKDPFPGLSEAVARGRM